MAANAGLTGLSRKHGVKVGTGSVLSVEEVALAVGQKIGHSSIKSAARMNRAVVLFLEKVEQVNTLVETGITVGGQFVQVTPLTQPAARITLSNVPPFISDEFLVRELSRHGKVVSPIRKMLSGCKSPLLRHVVSHRRQGTVGQMMGGLDGPGIAAAERGEGEVSTGERGEGGVSTRECGEEAVSAGEGTSGASEWWLVPAKRRNKQKSAMKDKGGKTGRLEDTAVDTDTSDCSELSGTMPEGQEIDLYPSSLFKKFLTQTKGMKGLDLGTYFPDRLRFIRKKEQHHIKTALKTCGYPDWAFTKTSRKRDPSKGEERNKRRSVSIPYLSGVSEKFRRILQKHDIPVHFKPSNTLRQRLVHPKDKTPRPKQSNVVYAAVLQ
ncbi:hypothetical protein D4764_06G0014230 [Takifugu flavidus]|uniref:Uncharacterized protein n=1 Tax=Takifugu flavidus TaxID=433684 RepID=A0A5C6MY54_9TELE|nr:hypothetical protein D4764_06G0014230 [Takifugu flavidus]